MLHEGQPDDDRRQVRLFIGSNSPRHRPSMSHGALAQKPPPAAAFTLIPRLYPEKQQSHQSCNSSLNPTPQRKRSWDQILTLKSNQSRLQKSTSALNLSKDKIVNIHTHKKRLKDLRELDQLAESVAGSRSAHVSPREELSSFPFLINAIEIREDSVRAGNAVTRKWLRPLRQKSRTQLRSAVS